MKILLTVAYLSAAGVPSIRTYEYPTMPECRVEASKWFAKLKVGSGRAWCSRVADVGER